jgi:putative phosphoribosyl transferase
MDPSAHFKELCPVQAVQIAELALAGEWVMPARAMGVALLFHCNGCDPVGRRAGNVAQVFQAHRLATVQFELPAAATSGPEYLCQDGVMGHERMGHHVAQVLDWVALNPAFSGLPVGLFGIAAGAAAVMAAASRRPLSASALVCSGGRLQLNSAGMARVRMPTLLIVGADDPVALKLNRTALRLLKCNKRLEVVPGASDCFDEPEALETVSELSAVWLQNHLAHRGNL